MFAGTFLDSVVGDARAVRFISSIFICLGLFASWQGYRELKRRNSLRIHQRESGTEYVWIAFDGSEKCSRKDPREDWDAANADADGDADGGGGGD